MEPGRENGEPCTGVTCEILSPVSPKFVLLKVLPVKPAKV
jgi:hypothetical protein